MLTRVLSMVLVVGVVAPAAAQIDVTGRWRVTRRDNIVGYAYETLFVLAQAGSALTVERPPSYSTGVIDPVSGVLHLNGQGYCIDFPGEYRIVPWSIDASVAADGQRFSGTFEESLQPTRSCLEITGSVEAVRLPESCGNGVVDAGEECDEGMSGGDCCTEVCSPRPADSPCRSDGSACATGGTCDGAGFCVQQPAAAGAVCRGPEFACDTAEVCDGVSLSCPPPSAPGEPDQDDDGILDGCDFCLGEPLENLQLRFGSFTPGRKDFLKLRASVRMPAGTPFNDPEFDPEFLTKYVTLRDASGGALVEERVPGTTISGPPFEWKLRGTKWTFTNRGTDLTRVMRMQMGPSRRDPNVWDVRIDIPRAALPDDVGTPPYAIEVELYRTGHASLECGRTVLGLPGTPRPSCSAPNGGGVVACK